MATNTQRGTALAVGLISGVLVALINQAKEGPAGDAGEIAGICEASALLPRGDAWLLGDNEAETQLFIFSPGQPLRGLPLGAEVEDIEAIAGLPDGRFVVVGSQSANKDAERKPLREQVMVEGGAPIRPDLSGCPACEAARGLAPKEGGLSIEGAAWFAGSLWLGARSPLVEGRAMLLRMEGDPAQALSVAEVQLVDLGGAGVRELTADGGALLILAGPPGAEAAPHGLYRLGSPGAAPERLAVELPPGAEGLGRTPAGGLLVVTDGDGKPGKACKQAATWARLPAPG